MPPSFPQTSPEPSPQTPGRPAAERTTARAGAGQGRAARPDPDAVAAVASAPGARVVLLGKPGCHLCDDARGVVRRVCEARGEAFVERSTLDDVSWEMAYWEKIPVLFVDGREVAHWFVDPAALDASLDG